MRHTRALLKFRPNFTKFGNFGGGQKKTPKFFNTLIHVLYNSNHTNICLDSFFFRKSILHVLISKKKLAKFRPNFAKFGNFGGGRNFGDTEIKNEDREFETGKRNGKA